jgi:hypothetical protein
VTKIRTGQAPGSLTRAQFHERFNVRFYDPAFEGERDDCPLSKALASVPEISLQATLEQSVA